MTTTTTTNFGIPIPPLSTGGTTDGYATLMQTADTAIKNASGLGAWTDYSATSTIIGWSSFTIKSIKYKKIGTLVVVNFSLSGTSNSTGLYFSMPYSNAGPLSGTSSGQATDNSVVLTAPAWITIGAGSSNVTIYKNFSAGDWTSGNTKSVMGQIIYETS